MQNSKFTSTHNKGFQLTFANHLTISVQWGTGNYCSRKSLNDKPFSEMGEKIVSSETAEIAIWDADGTWFNFTSDQVKGWVDTNEVAVWIELTMKSYNLAALTQLAMKKGLI